MQDAMSDIENEAMEALDEHNSNRIAEVLVDTSLDSRMSGLVIEDDNEDL